MVRCLVLILLGSLPLAAADSAAPKPTAPAPAQTPVPAPPPGAQPAAESAGPAPAAEPVPTLDPATAKRAALAADAYLQATNPIHADADSEKALAEAEVLVLEAGGFLEMKDPLKAGERYLEAVKRVNAIPDDQRPALGDRLRKLTRTLTALSRRLLADKAYDVGTPAPEPH
jgi:hypothetical protein